MMHIKEPLLLIGRRLTIVAVYTILPLRLLIWILLFWDTAVFLFCLFLLGFFVFVLLFFLGVYNGFFPWWI